METTETNGTPSTTPEGAGQAPPARRGSRRQLVVAILTAVYLCSGVPGLVAGVSADPRHAWGFSAVCFGVTMLLAVLGLAGALRGRRPPSVMPAAVGEPGPPSAENTSS